MPDNHAIAVLALTLFALFLFSRDKIPLQTSAFIVLCTLAPGFAIFPYPIVQEGKQTFVDPVHFFHGFGHEALIAVCALMAVGTGLVKTGALEPVGHMLSKMWQTSPSLSLLLTLLLTAGLSAFINNTPIVVLLIPILVSVALRTQSSPAALLMPMGFASLIGGMGTTIGTSTNLLVVSVASDLGLPRMSIFDFFFPAMFASIAGIAFLWLLAPRMLPKRSLPLSDSTNRVYTAQLLVTEDSSAVGKTVKELKDATKGKLNIDKIRRTENSFIVPLPDAVIEAGDKILIHDTPEALNALEKATGTVLYAKNERMTDGELPLKDEDQTLIEIIIDQRSPLLGRTLQSTRFIENYKMIALAVHRHGDKIREMPNGLGNFPLCLGDILLAQGKREDIDTLKSKHEFLVLDSTIELPLSKKAPLSILIMLLVVVLAATKVIPIAISSVLGVLAMLLTRCLNWSDVSRSLNVPVIMIVVSSLALGEAMNMTKASQFLADQFVGLTDGLSPPFILSGLILLMAIFTNVVSNNAAAVIGTPIAVSIATTLGLNPEPFVLAVLFGANMSYATPMAYKTNLLIMSAGNYKFSDFLRVGIPLCIIMWLSYSILLPIIYTL
ncbi:MAG: SLC13 family permease [Proteobacteria bacterium]|nr:MAG: SLC13 family permease [Pseudomonadota bacterium]